MRRFLFCSLLLATLSSGFSQEKATVNYEYKIFTTIESVIAGGLGRSRLLEEGPNGQMVEMELEHLFSITGIHMKNIHQNGATITQKINDYAKQGWELDKTVNGVYSREGSVGIYLTRYIFRRPAQ